MSVKYGLLALLATGPMYGARLRAEFEARTGGTWPLNVGQVPCRAMQSQTLARLPHDFSASCCSMSGTIIPLAW